MEDTAKTAPGWGASRWEGEGAWTEQVKSAEEGEGEVGGKAGGGLRFSEGGAVGNRNPSCEGRTHRPDRKTSILKHSVSSSFLAKTRHRGRGL